jgi:hypothetical protein
MAVAAQIAKVHQGKSFHWQVTIGWKDHDEDQITYKSPVHPESIEEARMKAEAYWKIFYPTESDRQNRYAFVQIYKTATIYCTDEFLTKNIVDSYVLT